MSKIRTLGLTAAIVLLVSAISPAHANNPGVSGPYLDGLRKRALENWVPAAPEESQQMCDMVANIAQNGKIYNIRITGSKSLQADADALQAVLGSIAYNQDVNPLALGDVHFALGFESPAYSQNGIEDYFRVCPEQKGKTIGFYLIPLDVLHRYPGLFREDQLLSANNVSVLKCEGTNANGLPLCLEQLRFIYSECWIPFFIEHRTTTQKEIKEFAIKLRSLFL
jgi:hypothetical protein